MSVTPKSLRVAEGASALFLCNVNTALLTISRSWSRDGYRLLPETAEVVDGTLAFRNARREDSGVYTCSASNQVTVDSATVIISVGGTKIHRLITFSMCAILLMQFQNILSRNPGSGRFCDMFLSRNTSF